MNILSVLGILFVCSPSGGQMEMFNIQAIYENVQNVENAFGKPLTLKLLDLAQEVYAGKFTPRQALEFFENLTPEETDGGARGLITLVKELAKVVSAPEFEEQLRMALSLAPFLLRQVVNAMPPEPQRQTEAPEPPRQPEVTEPPRQPEVPEPTAVPVDATSESEGVPSTEELRSMMGDLLTSGKVTDDFYRVVDDLLRMADEYNEDDEASPALDDKSTATLSQTGQNVIAKGDPAEPSAEQDVNDETNQSEKDEL